MVLHRALLGPSFAFVFVAGPTLQPDRPCSACLALHKLGISPSRIVYDTIAVRICPSVMVVRYCLLLLPLLLLLLLL